MSITAFIRGKKMVDAIDDNDNDNNNDVNSVDNSYDVVGDDDDDSIFTRL